MFPNKQLSTVLSTTDKAVLRKLYDRRAIGARHLRLQTLKRCGWKSNERGEVKTSVEKLIRLGLVVWGKRGKTALTLNKRRIVEIKALIGY